MIRTLIPILFTLTFLLAACGSPTLLSAGTSADPAQTTPDAPAGTPTPIDDPALLPLLFPNMGEAAGLTRTDVQGAVVVQVSPLNLGQPADTLDFDISMNTHSVDLSMDLALLATLITDTGIVIQPTLWDAPRGGHHVNGRLVFPALEDGRRWQNDANTLILQIRDVDVPLRTFEWLLK